MINWKILQNGGSYLILLLWLSGFGKRKLTKRIYRTFNQIKPLIKKFTRGVELTHGDSRFCRLHPQCGGRRTAAQHLPPSSPPVIQLLRLEIFSKVLIVIHGVPGHVEICGIGLHSELGVDRGEETEDEKGVHDAGGVVLEVPGQLMVLTRTGVENTVYCVWTQWSSTSLWSSLSLSRVTLTS